MNTLIRDHLAATYFAEYQVLRSELVDILRDDDLAFRPSPGTFTLGELCREIGEIEHSYVDALRTFRQDFGWRNPDPEAERSVAALSTWFADLDRSLLAAIEALTDEDVTNRKISRDDVDVEGFSPLPAQELDIYREALLIFYSKVSIYLRAMGRDLPGHWTVWIG
jgi:DinB family protein